MSSGSGGSGGDDDDNDFENNGKVAVVAPTDDDAIATKEEDAIHGDTKTSQLDRQSNNSSSSRNAVVEGIEATPSSSSSTSTEEAAAQEVAVVDDDDDVSLSKPNENDDHDDDGSPTTTVMTSEGGGDDDDDDDEEEEEEEDPDHQCQLWSNNNNNNNNNTNHSHDDDNDGTANNNNQQQQYSYGDIWSTDAFGLFDTSDSNSNNYNNNQNSLRTLLDSNNYSLVDLLGHEELLQELRGCNEHRLMEYLVKPDTVAGLVECLLLRWNGGEEEEDDDNDDDVDGDDENVALGGRGGHGVVVVVRGSEGKEEEGEKERKERWCAMEVKRREREEKEHNQRRELRKTTKCIASAAADIEDANAPPTGNTTTNNNNHNQNNNYTTLYDISSPRQLEGELRVEAQWNSPTDVASSSEETATAATTTTNTTGRRWPLHHDDDEIDDDDDDDDEYKKSILRTPEEEYDMQFIRYPYMACEVLCSDVMVGFVSNNNNTTKYHSMSDVLVDGYVNEVVGDVDDEEEEGDNDHDVVIHDEDDSLLDDGNSHRLGTTNAEKQEGYEDSCDDDNDLTTSQSDNTDEIRNIDVVHGSDGSVNGMVPLVVRPPPPWTRMNGDNLDRNLLLHHHSHHNKQQQQQHSSQPPRQIRILDLLFSVLIDTPPSSLDDRRAGYFEKVLNVLFQRRSQAMSDYMNTNLIVTDASMNMARQILGSMDKSALDAIIAPVLSLPGDSEKVDGAAASVSAYEDAIMERSSSYVSLSRQRSEDNTDDNDNNISSNSTTGDGANDTKPECKFPMPDAPPMLMCALFDHLHSYPIMHIVQRLLMPSPLRRQNADCQTKGSKGGESSSGEIVHSNMNSVHVMNAGADSAPSQGEDDDDDGCEVDDQIEDPMNQIFQCDWLTRRTDQALELLLRRLAGDTSSFLIGYGYPVGYDSISFTNNGKLQQHQQHHSLPPEDEEEVSLVEAREAALLCSQHASEILTTIIQCSSLDAPVMKSLSSNPSLQRIVDLIVLPPPSSESTSKNSDVDFVAHESIMTCAITVLESLVLQLGGYGAVVASPGATGNEKRESRPSNGKTNQENESLSPSEVGSTTSSKLLPNILPSLERAPTTTLRLHMTTLLTRLSELLNDPITDTWVRPSQYSGGQQRLLLGASRLHIVRLIESLVLLGDLDVDLALQTSDCLEKCIDLFWQFEWCSMLHQSAANLLVHVFEGGDCRSGLQEYLLGRCKLMQRLMDSFEFDPPDVDGTTEEGTLDLKENGIMEPRYGEMMLTMKTMFVAKCTSSMESERGSQCDDSAIEEDDGGMIAPVSEDDVDSAMEKECQDGNGDLSFTPLPQGKVTSQQLQFRKGYMGHVIIICQALVQACSHVAAEHVDNETSAIPLQEQSGTSETNVDESFLTLTNPPTSNAEIVSNNVTQSPRSNEPESSTIRKVSFIDELLRKHPLFNKWQRFVTSVLVPELSVQSTPLGGQPAPTSMSHMLPPVIHGDSESSLFEIDVDISSQSVGEFIVGEIDMDENDLDTAAAMIEALRVSSKRRRASGDETAVSIANFGSTIHQPGGFRDYVYDYDDPLGRLHPFESHDCNGGEDDHGYSESCNDSDDEGFMSDAMVISKDGIVANQARKINGSINKSGSDSSDEEEDDDDNNDVPVLDLFTGSFEPDFANFDAFETAVANGDNPFDSNELAIDSNTSQEVFFDAINGCINHPTTDNLFDFSDTPFDLVDTLSTEAESEENIVR